MINNNINAAIFVRNLSFSYPDKPDVLCGVNFQVSPGERVGIIGPNGAGKTSLFMSICGVLTPKVGEIMLFGKPVQPGEFRPEIGLVFQNPNDQLFCASVWDDVAFGPQNMGFSPLEVERRVQEAIAVTGLLELTFRPPHHLSGGEKRMVAIAGVLAMSPLAVIYDEPSANLDIRARRRLIRFLQSSEQTMLISSHDLELILETCDRVILMDCGKIIADGQPQEIMGNAQLMENHGLEKPHSLTRHQHHYDSGDDGGFLANSALAFTQNSSNSAKV
ncbi:MAG TPA: energy-coupling factor ABC transporter ATP-binding protein [Oscillatoriaceae cyanobacterium M33_DOE_052]|uniref:Energy-coupling factor ABC transporter ATP-binding protein n=1 Tax=Planktothricoides sp. SpSt-374 TaxID=2282167 RepID=A0A7C3VRD6_9CYAN|nr:energy-coupling factor ABC transporter ATP-binding protein [Oscillatoriaceae cyanobacterium M33_DOE_052]